MVTKRRHVKAIIQLRRAIESEWVKVNPILRVGEPALSTDVYKLKIGNGQDHWSEIPYMSDAEIAQFTEMIGNMSVTDLVDGVDYATIAYVDSVVPHYTAGNGIVIENEQISLDNLIIDCGTSTTNVGG